MELHALVLAAGTGSRFGGRKLLAPWGAGVLLHGALEAAYAAPVASVIIVTGADADAVSSVARAFATSNAPHMDQNIVHALDYAAGLSASLRAGLAAVPPSASGVFIFLGDMPRVPAAISTKLADAVKLCNILAAAPVHDGRRGHPVLVARSLFPRLLTLRGDEGARRILDELGPALSLVRTDDSGVLLDVDEVSDLARVGPKV